MVKRSQTTLKEADRGDNVAVPMSFVNCRHGNRRNMIVIVVDQDEQSMCKIETREGVLKASMQEIRTTSTQKGCMRLSQKLNSEVGQWGRKFKAELQM